MPQARVLLSVDYEPWAALLQREYNSVPSSERRRVDAGYALTALDDVLEVLEGVSVSVYLVGEIVDWYPDVPGRIVAAGHELGFHCHTHHTLMNLGDLRQDLGRSREWIQRFDVQGYRAPMIRLSHHAYQVLAEAGFCYSSSVYAPTGCVQYIAGVWEIPVSTWPVWRREPTWWWPRQLSMRLLAQGEFPYGSSFFVGIMGERILYWVERELIQGRSPVVVIHNHQIAPPSGWPKQIMPLLWREPWQGGFALSRRAMVARLVREFPVGIMGDWLDEYNNE